MTAAPGLAVALEGYGWHPEAWRHTADTRPVADGEYWTALGATACLLYTSDAADDVIDV